MKKHYFSLNSNCYCHSVFPQRRWRKHTTSYSISSLHFLSFSAEAICGLENTTCQVSSPGGSTTTLVEHRLELIRRKTPLPSLCNSTLTPNAFEMDNRTLILERAVEATNSSNKAAKDEAERLLSDLRTQKAYKPSISNCGYNCYNAYYNLHYVTRRLGRAIDNEEFKGMLRNSREDYMNCDQFFERWNYD